MLDCIVVGAAGRMAGRVCALVHGADDMRLVGAVEGPGHAAVGSDIGGVIGVGDLGVAVSTDLGSACPHWRPTVEPGREQVFHT